MIHLKLGLTSIIVLCAILPDLGYCYFHAVARTRNGNQDILQHREKRQSGAMVPVLDMEQYHVTTLVTARYVRSSISTTLINRANQLQGITINFDLTPEALLSEFVLIVDGVPYEAQVMGKEAAMLAHNDAQRQGQTSGYIKQQDPLKFEVDLIIAPDSSVTFNLTYEELLRRDRTVFTLNINIVLGQIVADLKADVFITEPEGLDSLEAWWQPQNADPIYTHIDKSFTPGSNQASVVFNPSVEFQSNFSSTPGMIGQLVVKYNIIHRPGGGHLQINNGYFVHYISPDHFPPAPKKVVFVIDISGSMYGRKLAQTKQAMVAILNDLREIDHFNILIFSTNVQSWKPSTVPVTIDTMDEAVQFVQRLFATGGTNIHSALHDSVAGFGDTTNAFPIIVFMTDGVPSVGVLDSDEIVSSVTNAIGGKIALYCVGFGDDVDDVLLRRLAASNRGQTRKILDNENAAAQMEGFFKEVSTPLLYNIETRYDEHAVSPLSLTQSYFLSYFEGEEIIIAAKINDDFEGKALMGHLTANARDGPIHYQLWQDIVKGQRLGERIIDDYAERIWAYLTIQDVLLKWQLATESSEKEALKERALSLSLEYGFVTDLTSMFLFERSVTRATTEKPVLERLPGPRELSAGSYQPPISKVFGDPHFIIEIPNTDIVICFNVNGDKGSVINILHDPVLNILINAEMVPVNMNQSKHSSQPERAEPSLFGKIGVQLGHQKIVVSAQHVLLDFEVSTPWGQKKSIVFDHYNVTMHNEHNLTISRDNGIVMRIRRHLWEDHPVHFDFYLEKSRGFSNALNGIIGQFQHNSVTVNKDVHRMRNGLMKSIMYIDNKEVDVHFKSNFSGDGIDCWLGKADSYLDGGRDHYVVPDLFARIK